MNLTIVPAILTKDQVDLAEKAALVATWQAPLHLDYADGRFVANTTLSLAELAAGTQSNIDRELHLMAEKPLELLDEALKLGFQRVLIHFEAVLNPQEFLHEVMADRLPVGFVINSKTPLIKILELSQSLMFLQLMGVTPGFQHQPFDATTPARVTELARALPDTIIQVDGSVNQTSLPALVQAGAHRFVVGSALWQDPRGPRPAYEELTLLLNQFSK